MLLAVDVGNTSSAFALFEGSDLVTDWRLTTRPERTGDELATQLIAVLSLRQVDPSQIDAMVVGSVVPSFNPALVEAARQLFGVEPLMVGPGVRTGVRIRYESPRDVGPDRIANAVAVFRRFGGPAIVIDLGTAVTYDAISAEGDYLGGAIGPGIQISHDVLVAQTALLRRVELLAPDSVIGTNTVHAIQAGLMWGFVAQVEGMVRRMTEELGGQARVVATGGQAHVLAGLTPVIEKVEPLLTLEGLRLIHELQQGG